MGLVIRLFDVVIAFTVLLIFAPLLIIVALIIKLTSKGPVLFRQVRVGRHDIDFRILKFRTMLINADKLGSLTVGARDPRVTSIGYFLRKYKLDELPQLINVLIGDMSIVGPRPELRKYVDMYTSEQKKILAIRPGITDYASIEYRNENELLAAAANPELFYIEQVMPQKIRLNYKYLHNRNPVNYFKVIFSTIFPSVN